MTCDVKHSLTRHYSENYYTIGKMNNDFTTEPTRKTQKPGVYAEHTKKSDSVQHQGKGVNGCGTGSTSFRAEPRFETFLMTGDMMIKTTNVSALSRVDRNKKPFMESKETEKCDLSPIPAPPPPPIEEVFQLPEGDRFLQPHILPDVVQNDRFGGSVSGSFSVHNEDSLPDRRQLEISNHPCCMDASIELDIPPDDISSDDERYRIEGELNIDDLPPPPEEFLTDFTPTQVTDSDCLDHTVEDVHLGGAEFLHNDQKHVDFSGVKQPDSSQDVSSYCSLNAGLLSPTEGIILSNKDSFAASNDDTGSSLCPVISKTGIPNSRSEEKLSPRMILDKADVSGGVVRGSKSQENCLQCDGEGVVVDIDFGENVATSVDALHYQKSCSSLEGLGDFATKGRAIRSLDNSPEKQSDINSQERVFYQKFIGLDEPKLGSKKADEQFVKLQKNPAPDRTNSARISSSQDTQNFENSSGHRNNAHSKKVVASLQIGSPKNASVSGIHMNDFDEPEISETASGSVSCLDRQGLDSRSAAESGCLTNNNSVTILKAETVDRQPSSSEVLEGLLEDEFSSARGDRALDYELDEDPTRIPFKDVDRPSAQRLAKRLYDLKGFNKSDVAKHLGKKNDFAQLVGEEYLKNFDLTSQSLDSALRTFLQRLVLSGETQERERILAQFSHRFLKCNPGSFSSEDSCHTLTCAMMLLNTDLHQQNVGRKMTLEEFIENLADLNDGENFPRELLRFIYRSIQNDPIEMEFPDTFDLQAGQKGPSYTLGSNPFLDVSDPSKATEFKNGCVMRKCCIDPDGRRTALGKRGWKMFYVTLRDMVLYLYKDQESMKSHTHFHNSNNAIRVHHSLATKADDYTKKQHVFRLQTTDGAQYLFQTSDSHECESWINEVNFVTAAFSAPPLPSAVGSQKKFQRPLMPSSRTKLNLVDQLDQHKKMLEQIEMDLGEHMRLPPDKGSKSRMIQDYLEKESYLQFEQKRFTTYCSIIKARHLSGELSELIQSKPLDDSIDGSYPASAVEGRASSSSVQRSLSDRYSYKASLSEQSKADLDSQSCAFNPR